MTRPLGFCFLLVLLLLLVSCGSPAHDPASRTIVATTDILADLVAQVAGGEFEVSSLVKEGNSPHNFIPTPQDLVKIARAEILFAFGGGLEDSWMNKLILNSGTQGDYITLSPLILPEILGRNQGDGDSHESLHGHHRGEEDPHVWMDPILMLSLVEAVAETLSEHDPGNSPFYRQNAENYVQKLRDLDAWIRTETDRVPPERRRIVTTHEFLGRYAERYGYEIIGTALPSNPHGEPSASATTHLIAEIRAQNVTVLFAEETLSARTLEVIGREAGAHVVTDLLAGTLGGTGSYLGFMHHNTRVIVTALAPAP